jgi:hypothetical protein
MVFASLQMAAGNPGEASVRRLNCIPPSGVMAVDFDLSAAVEFVGRIVIVAGAATHIDAIGILAP